MRQRPPGRPTAPVPETVAGRRRGQLAESEEVGRRHQSRERPGPRWAGRTLGPWAAGKRAPALPASPTPTPSAASFVPCGSGASRWLVSCGVPPSVAPPLAPAPLPAPPPPRGPPCAGRQQAGGSSSFPGAAAMWRCVWSSPASLALLPDGRPPGREGSCPSAAVHRAGSGVRGSQGSS